MPDRPHDKTLCPLCRKNAERMKVECVADFLCKRQQSVYHGRDGMKCLEAGKVGGGRNVYWLRCRVEAHKIKEDEYGACDGSCVRVMPMAQAATFSLIQGAG